MNAKARLPSLTIKSTILLSGPLPALIIVSDSMAAAHIANVAAFTPRGSANCDGSTKSGLVSEVTDTVTAATAATNKANISLTQTKRLSSAESTGSLLLSQAVEESSLSGMVVYPFCSSTSRGLSVIRPETPTAGTVKQLPVWEHGVGVLGRRRLAPLTRRPGTVSNV